MAGDKGRDQKSKVGLKIEDEKVRRLEGEKDKRQRSEVSGQWSVVSGQGTEGIEKFQGLFKRSLELNKKNWKKAVERVWEYYPDEKIVLGVVPDDDEGLRVKVSEWIKINNTMLGMLG